MRPIFLPPSLYEAAKNIGCDMTCYCKTEPIPQNRDVPPNQNREEPNKAAGAIDDTH